MTGAPERTPGSWANGSSAPVGVAVQNEEVVPVGRAVEVEPAVAIALFGDGLPQARAYVELLAGPGTVRGLIGPREAGRLWTRHLINSVLLADLVPGFASVADIGSGAGLPGIPLAIARPDCRVVLVEPLERRALFLTEAVRILQLKNVQVVRGRAEHLDQVRAMDVVTSRALAPLATVGSLSAPLLRPGGLLLAIKGASAAEEVTRDAEALSRAGLGEITVQELGGDRVATPTVIVRAVRASTAAAGGVRPRRTRVSR